jgi:ATP-dependent DNA helicase
LPTRWDWESVRTRECEILICRTTAAHVLSSALLSLSQKTVTTVAFLRALVHKNLRGPFLVIAPLAVTPHWQREFESWTDEISVVKYADNQKSRDTIQEYELNWEEAMGCATPEEKKKMKTFKGKLRPNVIIVAQDTFRQDIEFFERFTWQCLVTDEAHMVRNQNSKYFQCLSHLKAKHKIFLTGTRQ